MLFMLDFVTFGEQLSVKLQSVLLNPVKMEFFLFGAHLC